MLLSLTTLFYSCLVNATGIFIQF